MHRINTKIAISEDKVRGPIRVHFTNRSGEHTYKTAYRYYNTIRTKRWCFSITKTVYTETKEDFLERVARMANDLSDKIRKPVYVCGDSSSILYSFDSEFISRVRKKIKQANNE